MSRWRALLVALVICFGPMPSAHAAPRRIDSVAMKRSFFEIRVESGRLVNNARTFLLRTGRWYPEGDDELLWAGIKAFDDAVDAVAGEYARTSYPKSMEKQTRAVMEHAKELDAILAQAKILAGLKIRWSDLQKKLAVVAEKYGWDYANARFESEPEPETPVVEVVEEEEDDDSLYQPPPLHFEEDIDPDRKNRLVNVPSRFTVSDDVAVGEAINEIDHLTRSVLVRLSASRVAATGDFAEDDRQEDGRDLPEEMEQERIEADLLAFESATSEAQHRFALSQRAADIRLEVATLLKLGRRIEQGFRREQLDADALAAWTSVRGKLNFLAVVYDLEILRYQ